MNGIRRALLLATAERYVILVVGFATLAIVSRILTPPEIGVSVVGMAVVMMALAFREFASPNFIIQHKNLQLEDVRATFTILSLTTLAISTIIFALAGWLAVIYSEPRLEPFLRIVAISTLVEIIGVTIAALLRREMAFGKLAFINVVGAAVYAGLTITLAILGFSYMSFAWAFLASVLTTAFLSLALWPDRSIFRPCLRAWRGVVTFGGYSGTNVFLFKVFESLPYLVLGRILSFDAVALYNRAWTVCQIPDRVILQGIDSVLLPAFSSEVRGGRGLRNAYLHSVELITGVQWPALIVLALLADPIVRFLLGEQWADSVPLVQIMAIAWLPVFTQKLNYPILVAMGEMRDLLKRSLITWPVSAVIITCAAFFGLKAAVLSWLVLTPFWAYVSIYFVKRHVEIRWRDFAKPLQIATTLAICSAAGPLAIMFLTGDGFELSYSATTLAALLSAMGWGIGLWATGHPLLPEIKRAISAITSTASLSKKVENVPNRI